MRLWPLKIHSYPNHRPLQGNLGWLICFTEWGVDRVLLENYRQRRLAYNDVVALLALGKQIQVDPELLVRTEKQAKQEREQRWHSWEPEMIHIPPGRFLMGSRLEDKDARENEHPQHTVYLDGYWIGKSPITNAQYRSVGYA